jgi:diaminopimelate decarboxylase
MNELYRPPSISPELGRSTEAAIDRNYFARGSRAPIVTDIDGLPVDAIARHFGSPVFVFSEATLRAKAKRMKRAFLERYPNTLFSWSYKTNYLNAVCKIIHSEGWEAEVVSDFEYHKARALGIPGEQITVNGPHKPLDLLKLAAREGALIQIDNWDEMGLVLKLASQSAMPINVGIRTWMDAGVRPVWSKFGFAIANGEAERAAALLIAHPKLKLKSLHAHIGTYVLEPVAYRNAARSLLSLRESLHDEYGVLVDCINLGGGFPSYSKLHGMAGNAEDIIPPIEAYASAIAGVFNDLPPEKRPRLMLESGRHLVDEAGHLITRIVSVKGSNRVPLEGADLTARDAKEWLILSEHARTGYVVDAGVNLLYTAAWFAIDAKPARLVNVPPSPARLYGSLCMAIDVIRDHVELPPLEAGDLLTLHPVGAYNVSKWMQFITYRPAVVLVTENGTAELIRRREELQDINGPELMPEHLMS